MQASDLATAGFIHDNFQVILQHLQALQQGRPAAGSDMPRLLSIEQVMEELEVSRSTVQRWLKKGKPGRHGGTIVLQAYWFTTAEPRIPWPALAAFGQGLGFDLATLNQGAAPEPAAPPTPRRAA
jgi:hypothetical protein